jgi:hypothetical protein
MKKYDCGCEFETLPNGTMVRHPCPLHSQPPKTIEDLLGMPLTFEEANRIYGRRRKPDPDPELPSEGYLKHMRTLATLDPEKRKAAIEILQQLVLDELKTKN